MPRHLCIILSTIAAGPLVAAVPLIDVDLRLGYTLRQKNVEVTASGSGAGIDDSQDWDSVRRLEGGAVVAAGPGPIGWVVGGWVILDNADAKGGGSYDAVIGEVGIGPALKLPLVRIELMPFIGLGNADFDLGSGKSDQSSYLEYGVRLNAPVTFPGGFQVGASLAYVRSDSSHDFTVGGNHVETEVEQENLQGTIFIGYRL